MFELDRTFCQRNDDTGLMDWYFDAREGIYGPYSTKQKALKELNLFIERNKQVGNCGGRDVEKDKLVIMPLEVSLKPKIFDPTKKKKGIDD